VWPHVVCVRERDVGYSNGSVWPHVVCVRERDVGYSNVSVWPHVVAVEMLESLRISVESTATRGESHRIVVRISDVVIVVDSTSISRILTILDTVSHSAVSRCSNGSVGPHRSRCSD